MCGIPLMNKVLKVELLFPAKTISLFHFPLIKKKKRMWFIFPMIDRFEKKFYIKFKIICKNTENNKKPQHYFLNLLYFFLAIFFSFYPHHRPKLRFTIKDFCFVLV